MTVSVIAVLPANDALRNSALAMLKGQPPPNLTHILVGKLVKFAPDYYAVPLGSGHPEDRASVADFTWDKSQAFAVRAWVEGDSYADISSALFQNGGLRIFADPKIVPFAPPLDISSSVRNMLHRFPPLTPIGRILDVILGRLSFAQTTCLGSAGVGDSAVVAEQLGVPWLAAKGLDGTDVAIAIMDGGINLAHLTGKLGFTPILDPANSWTPLGSTDSPGGYPVDHGTMCAFDALIAAPNATLLDFPILANPGSVGTIAEQVLAGAIQGNAKLITVWADQTTPGVTPKFKALVSSNSWGIAHPDWDLPLGDPGRYIDNPAHPFNLQVAALADSGVDIVFAAGNCGAECPEATCKGRTTESIMGAAALSKVLTIGGCNTRDVRVGYSSQGPAMAGTSPGMTLQKPDVAAYTHFDGSGALLGSVGSGPRPDIGTSAACPVAAGCVAALRTSVSPTVTSPAAMIATIQSSARLAPGQTARDDNFGYGIIYPMNAAINLGL